MTPINRPANLLVVHVRRGCVKLSALEEFPVVNTIAVKPGDRSSHHKLVIGLAGGIASGKSTVADFLRELGAAIIDSDRMVHEELSRPDVVETLLSWWGKGICCEDGRINKAGLAGIIFADHGQRQRLEEFLYPRLEARRRDMMTQMDADESVSAIVINSPLLFEVGLDCECDQVIFVDCDRESRLRRVIETRGWTEEELDKREKLQKSLEEKRQRADYVVDNNSGIDAVRSCVQDLFHQLLSKNKPTA